MTPQQKLFFALCKDGGWDTEVMKERAKALFSANHFADLTPAQLSNLIDRMKIKLASKKT